MDPRAEGVPEFPRDERRHYSAHVERAVAYAERAHAFATGDGAAQSASDVAVCATVAYVGSAVVDALLAVADRVDVLIGCAFDEGRPVSVRQVEVDD